MLPEKALINSFFFFLTSATHSLQSLNTAIKDVFINMELYSDDQFFAYPSKHNFTALVHCQRLHSLVFREKAEEQPVSRDRYFPQEAVETKNRAKKGRILLTHRAPTSIREHAYAFNLANNIYHMYQCSCNNMIFAAY